MKERALELWKTHKKLCITGGAVVASALLYIFGGFEVAYEVIVEKTCGILGGC